MKKTIYPTQFFLFFLFWLPAFLFELSLRLMPRLIFTIQPILFLLIRYGFALLFLLGWFISFIYSSYSHPQKTLGGILLYFGVSILLVTFQYTGYAASMFPTIGSTLSGLFSYTPLRGFTQYFINYDIPYELYTILILTFLFLLAWVIGIVVYRGYQGYDSL